MISQRTFALNPGILCYIGDYFSLTQGISELSSKPVKPRKNSRRGNLLTMEQGRFSELDIIKHFADSKA